MTEHKSKDLQTQIARLEELDTDTINRVNNRLRTNRVNDLECSLELDYEFHYQSM